MSLLAVLSNLLPTILLAIPLGRRWPTRSVLCIGALSWTIGQVIATPATYLLACLLVGSVSPTLEAASKLLLALEAVACMALIAFTKPRPGAWLREAFRARGLRGALIETSFLAAALSFSYFLFAPHVVEEGGSVYRSATYWDFTAHYPIVQNFVFGDNFPAKDETAGELPLLYHFFGDLQIAAVSALGTPLAGSFLWISALSLASLLIVLREFAREIFRSEAAGWAAALFAITSSDLRWAFDMLGKPCAKPVWWPFMSYIHPLTFGIPKCSFGDFNVSMFNLFYFVEERHVLFSSLLILVAAMLLRGVATISVLHGAFLGSLFGLFSSWNAFIAPMLLMLLLPGLFRAGRRLGSAVAMLALVAMCAYPAILLQEVVTKSGWFSAAELAPRFNFGFAAANASDTISLVRFLEYYAFSIGPTILCAGLGLAVAWRRSREDFWLFASLLFGTFVLINAVQPMPQSVYENHKWVKPWQGFLQIAAAAPIGILMTRFSVFRLLAAILVVAVMTASGIAEAIPFFARDARELVVEYQSPLIEEIRSKTRPSDVFATSSPREVLMSGRRIYVLYNEDMSGTIPHLRGLSFRFASRKRSQERLYAAQRVGPFCEMARQLGVSVVEFAPNQQAQPLFVELRSHVIITADIPRKGGKFAYVSTDFCPQLSTVVR